MSARPYKVSGPRCEDADPTPNNASASSRRRLQIITITTLKRSSGWSGVEHHDRKATNKGDDRASDSFPICLHRKSLFQTLQAALGPNFLGIIVHLEGWCALGELEPGHFVACINMDVGA